MVQFLIEQGADLGIRAATGENAYEMMLKNSHQKNYMEVAALLKQHVK